MSTDTPSAPARRSFMRTLGGAAAGGLVAPWGLNLAAWTDAAAAEGDDYKALICLYLDGGNDQDNTLVPYDSASHARYLALRGGGATPIAVRRELLGDTVLSPTVPLASGRQYALHPQMRGLAGLFQQGRAAVQLNLGPLIVPLTRAQYASGDRRYPVPPKLFSHNDQKATSQSAVPEGAVAGYGGRLGDLSAASNRHALLSSISVGSGDAVFLSGQQVSAYQMTVQGAVPISPAVVERGPAPSALAALMQAPRSHVLEAAYSQVVRQSMAANDIVSGALGSYQPASDASYLSNQLRLVVRMASVHAALGMKRQVFFVRQPSYDTHGTQLSLHPRLLGELSASLLDFDSQARAAGLSDRLTLFTASEFGRTLTPNGDGTDHGWGGHHFIVGGAVKGGAFYGTPPPVSAGNTSAADDQWHVGQGRLLPSTSVAQFMATLARWFGVPPDKLAEVVPDIGNFGAAAGRPDYPVDLGFMR